MVEELILDWSESRDVGATSVYQTRWYGRAAALSQESTWNSLGDEAGAWHIPLSLSSLGGGLTDAASPYGYPGMHVASELSDATARAAWDEVTRILADRGVVSLFVRFAPFRPAQIMRATAFSGLDIVPMSDTVLVPTIRLQETWAGMEGRARNAIRKAEGLGMGWRVSPATAELGRPDAPFRRLYAATMRKLGAQSHHEYPDDYYRLLVAEGADRIHVAEVLGPDLEVIAAALLLVDDDTVHYHLSGSDPLRGRQGANNLLVWAILRFAAQQGIPRVHLGGGTRRGDSLFLFKRSFGGEAVPFHVGRLIVLRTEYLRLTRARAEELRTTRGDLETSGYFPAYRAVATR